MDQRVLLLFHYLQGLSSTRSTEKLRVAVKGNASLRGGFWWTACCSVFLWLQLTDAAEGSVEGYSLATIPHMQNIFL